MVKPLSFLYVLLPFAYYYIGTVALLSYFYGLKALNLKLPVYVLLPLVFVLMFWLVLIAKQDIFDGLLVARFFWGWIFFYLFFLNGYLINLHSLLKIIAILVIIEAAIVNTLISATELPNYPDAEFEDTHIARDGNYQRPFSFGGSASVTSAVIVSIMAHLRQNLRSSFLGFAAIAACMSGTGFFLLLLSFFYRYWRNFLFLLVLVPLFLYVFFENMISRFSLDYVTFLFHDKLTQWSHDGVADSVQDFLVGQNLAQVGAIGGDFQILSFLNLNGVVGVALLFVLVGVNLNRLNWFPIVAMLLGTMHYGVIFYLPGQFMFGYFLALRSYTLNRN